MQPLDPNELRMDQNQQLKLAARENQQNRRLSPVPVLDGNADRDGKVGNKLIDLNAKPQRMHGQTSTNQVSVFPKFCPFLLLSFLLLTLYVKQCN